MVMKVIEVQIVLINHIVFPNGPEFSIRMWL